jgi:hypothetical protein
MDDERSFIIEDHRTAGLAANGPAESVDVKHDLRIDVEIDVPHLDLGRDTGCFSRERRQLSYSSASPHCCDDRR